MLTCTFFGHKDTPSSIALPLRNAIKSLITDEGVRRFLVGNNGRFDEMALRALEELEKEYGIEYSVVYAYMPKENAVNWKHGLYPEKVAKTPKRFAIDARNLYMLTESQYVISYVKYAGGAKKFEEKAQQKNKKLIKLA